MSLKIPSLANSRCVSLTVCGELAQANPELEAWIARKEKCIALLKGREKRYLRVIFGGTSGRHLHLDLIASNFFVKKPENLTEPDEVLESLKRFEGVSIKASLSARFEVAVEDLPLDGVIRSIFFETKTGNVGIKVSGAQFRITGAPVSSINWVSLSEKMIGIVIEAEDVSTIFSSDYLTTALKRLETALKVFVLGKVPNEHT